MWLFFYPLIAFIFMISRVTASPIIVGNPTFVCELKRQDHTKSKWQDGQLEFLEASQKRGAFVCVAFGYLAALNAVKDYILISTKS